VAFDGWRCPRSSCLLNWYVYRTLLIYRLISCFVDTPNAADDLINRQHGQDVIDSLSVLEAVVPTLHRELWPKIRELFPMIAMALRSRFAIIRQSASRCFAAICNVMTVDAMRFVIETILPLLGDTLINPNRQGATELVFSASVYRSTTITY
jgi:TATA-binding protein-associated factor